MLKRAHLITAAAFALTLTACGTAATPASEFPPTLVLPSRVPIIEPTSATGADALPTQPTAVADAPTATATRVRPTLTPTITLIPPTGTPIPPTETPLPTNTPAPDPERGALLFANGFEGRPNVPTCASCHYVEQVAVNDLVGPLMKGIASRAASRDETELNAVTYLRNSIIAPNKYLVPNEGEKVYAAGNQSLMHQTYATDLTPDEINDLVAYLLTLRE